jgi:hypothetical protein
MVSIHAHATNLRIDKGELHTMLMMKNLGVILPWCHQEGTPHPHPCPPLFSMTAVPTSGSAVGTAPVREAEKPSRLKAEAQVENFILKELAVNCY